MSREHFISNVAGLSSYATITLNCILKKYPLPKLESDELAKAIKYNNVYKLLTTLPARNLLNGIVSQQSYDYLVYLQKLFIDYLLSGEGSKSEEVPGGKMRSDLEAQRQRLLDLGKVFQEQELEHKKQIAAGQRNLLQLAKQWDILSLQVTKSLKAHMEAIGHKNITENAITQAINVGLMAEGMASEGGRDLTEEQWLQIELIIGFKLDAELRQHFMAQITILQEFTTAAVDKTQDLLEQAVAMTTEWKDLRNVFHTMIVDIQGTMRCLPTFRMDENQVNKNKIPLDFDLSIPTN